MGGGAAFVDVNNDGFLDIYVTGGLAVDKLYINQGDGTFVEMGEEYGFGITKDFFTSAVAVGDIENDGDADIIVTTWVGSSDGINKRNLFLRMTVLGHSQKMVNLKVFWRSHGAWELRLEI